MRAVELADGTRIECDLLVTATGWTAPTALLNVSGDAPLQPARGQVLPRPAAAAGDVLATGGIAGDGTLEELTEHAAAVGAEAARRAAATAAPDPAASPPGAAAPGAPPVEPLPIRELPVDPHPELFRAARGMVDFSEDVSAKDLSAAVAEGYDLAELAKRFTTATMGPVQGKLETVNTVAVIAAATGHTIAETGTTTWRPPYVPVTLGALAGAAGRAGALLAHAALARGARRPPRWSAGAWIAQTATVTRPPRRGTSASTSASSTSPRSASWTCAVPTCPRC